jgi:hypothetical protein
MEETDENEFEVIWNFNVVKTNPSNVDTNVHKQSRWYIQKFISIYCPSKKLKIFWFSIFGVIFLSAIKISFCELLLEIPLGINLGF